MRENCWPTQCDPFGRPRPERSRRFCRRAQTPATGSGYQRTAAGPTRSHSGMTKNFCGRRGDRPVWLRPWLHSCGRQRRDHALVAAGCARWNARSHRAARLSHLSSLTARGLMSAFTALTEIRWPPVPIKTEANPPKKPPVRSANLATGEPSTDSAHWVKTSGDRPGRARGPCRHERGIAGVCICVTGPSTATFAPAKRDSDERRWRTS